VRSRNIFFAHVLVAVRQGQCRDAVATGKERIGRCTAEQNGYIGLYRYSGILALAAMYLRRVQLCGKRSTTGACLCRWNLRHKTSARASGGPAGIRREAACIGRWRTLPQHGPPRRVQRPHIRWIAFLNSEIRSGPIAFPDRLSCSRKGGAGSNQPKPLRRSHKFVLAQQRFPLNSPCIVCLL
jgi:hypothetical protein